MPKRSIWDAARGMREAIDRMELAMMGTQEIVGLPEAWGEPRHRDEIGVTVKLTAGQVYRLCDACAELTRIINSEEYEIAGQNTRARFLSDQSV